jgi:ferrous iron transport protein B
VGVVDLPGTYALGGAAEEDAVARRALVELRPDVVLVVVDPSALARNLYLAIEILELGLPVVVAVNLADEARRSGIEVDVAELGRRLGVKAVLTVATQGIGMEELIEASFAAKGAPSSGSVEYGRDFEALVQPLIAACELEERSASDIPCRAVAIGLVEGRPDALDNASVELRRAADSVRTAMRGHFAESPAVHLARERHGVAGLVAAEVVHRSARPARWLPRDLWSLTTWPWTGVPLVIAVAGSIFGFLFFVGELLAGAFANLWASFASPLITSFVTAVAGTGVASRILLWGFDAGIEASLAIGLPYILTFYFLLGLLEDTGYLNSLAFLTDRVMHRFGLHGRAVVPLVAAAGCNVPALVAAGQLPTERERRIASTLVLFIPCSARTAVILGAVGHYIGWQPALLVLGIVFAVWLGVAFLLERMLPGDSRGLVMEMFGFRRPSLRRVAAKAWVQFREFLFVATPIVVAGSLVLGGLYESGWLMYLSTPLAPVVEGWLGLPAIAGVTLVAGMLRKELSLQLLVALVVATAGAASAGLGDMMTPIQLVVYALVNAIALPCISSVAVFWRRQGALRTAAVIAASVAVAVVLGGVVSRVLALTGFGA